MGENRPSWQRDGCPAWCAGGHEELDHPDDRVHRSDAIAVPVFARRTWFDGGSLRRSVDEAEFEVGISRADGEAETWLYVGDGPTRSIEFDVEGADRLTAAIMLVAARSR